MSTRTRELSPARGRELSLEKRREQRSKASGSVSVSFRDSRDHKIEGQLIDVSQSGFRMAHTETSLPTGQIVEFSHSRSSGQARVMWNRIAEGTVETGFLVISR